MCTWQEKCQNTENKPHWLPEGPQVASGVRILLPPQKLHRKPPDKGIKSNLEFNTQLIYPSSVKIGVRYFPTCEKLQKFSPRVPSLSGKYRTWALPGWGNRPTQRKEGADSRNSSPSPGEEGSSQGAINRPLRKNWPAGSESNLASCSWRLWEAHCSMEMHRRDHLIPLICWSCWEGSWWKG